MGFLGLCSCIFATVFGILVTIKQRRNTGDADDFTKRKSGDLELGRIDEAPEGACAVGFVLRHVAIYEHALIRDPVLVVSI